MARTCDFGPRSVGLSLCPVGLILFVREVFGDTPRRWLLRLCQGLLVATATIPPTARKHVGQIARRPHLVASSGDRRRCFDLPHGPLPPGSAGWASSFD